MFMLPIWVYKILTLREGGGEFFMHSSGEKVNSFLHSQMAVSNFFQVTEQTFPTPITIKQ